MIIDKFQQSNLYMYVKAPQLQFIDRLVDVLVLRTETCTHSAYSWRWWCRLQFVTQP